MIKLVGVALVYYFDPPLSQNPGYAPESCIGSTAVLSVTYYNYFILVCDSFLCHCVLHMSIFLFGERQGLLIADKSS